ncbi:MAG: hypothetical protein WC700_14270 [Gemmatimonadaceae bacterium]
MAENNTALARVQQRAAVEQQLVHTDEQGHTMLAIPPELSQRFNVLAPSAVLAQDDPYFKPGFTIVSADPDADNGADFYKLQGKFAPTKVLLQKLGDAAGVTFDPDKSHGIAGKAEDIELPGGKRLRVDGYTYHAVGYVRKSDGTMKALTADEEWLPHVALMEIETSVGARTEYQSSKLKYPPGTPAYNVAVEKDFLFSARKRAQMMRSKAMNGVLRQALSSKQAYTSAEIAKPFFVVGYNWSPDADNPETARIVAALVGADVSALYGAQPERPALAEPVMPEPVEDEPPTFDAETGEVLEGQSVHEGEEDIDAALAEEGAYVMPFSNKKDSTLAAIWAEDGGPGWFKTGITWLDAQQDVTEAQAEAYEHMVAYKGLMHRKEAAK